jgi:hypothetical protein
MRRERYKQKTEMYALIKLELLEYLQIDIKSIIDKSNLEMKDQLK